MHARFKSIEQRFSESFIPEPNSGCWLWDKSYQEFGYGHMSIKNRPVLAHRLSWELNFGPIPHGMFVCHKCDVTCCVNPSHLFLGTQKDNIADMLSKGRGVDNRGTKHWNAKLKDEDILTIRKDGRKQAVIAREFGVRQSLISMIKSGKIWCHVQ